MSTGSDVAAAIANIQTITTLPTVDQIVAQLKATKVLLMNALLLDASNPQPDYGLEGDSVSRTSWRSQLTQQLQWIDSQLAVYEPYEIYQVGY